MQGSTRFSIINNKGPNTKKIIIGGGNKGNTNTMTQSYFFPKSQKASAFSPFMPANAVA